MIIIVKHCNFPHHFLMLHVVCTCAFVHWQLHHKTIQLEFKQYIIYPHYCFAHLTMRERMNDCKLACTIWHDNFCNLWQ